MIKTTHNKHKIMPRWHMFLNTSSAAISLPSYKICAYLALFILTTKCTICLGDGPCEDKKWWDSVRDKCTFCTECIDNMIVLRPCQYHKDTLCGTLNEVEYNWSLLARTEPNWKERRKEMEANNRNTNNDDGVDWQATSLAVAAIACLLFFISAAYIAYQHAKQWRQIERRFDKDVEELSARLMQTLAEIRNTDNHVVIIDEQHLKEVTRPLEVRCVYLEQLLAGKDSLKNPGRGNVYIEENGTSKG